MSRARDEILGAIRRSLARRDEEGARDTVNARLREPIRGPVPARGQVPHESQVALFESWAIEQAATVARVPGLEAVPRAVAEFLSRANLPARIKLAPDPALEALPWARDTSLEIAVGPGDGDDEVSVTGSFAGIAETGTLMLASGRHQPTTLAFLPETHIVVLEASRIVGSYEDAWDRLRARRGRGLLPRTVNFVTGPSRTADIEQTIELGAHGPRRLHILIVEDGPAAGAQDQGAKESGNGGR